eukprot:TRINITY_DN11311_c0_g1_i1.p1 TRINITY_DN11311_c0_g1~~TRINITY_DN11311_c0_g1_i1.p1  ORF type:complete len:276 (+),score=42.37 TRINITY_DN11311_c0_g1_i1:25-828(+)
MQRDTFSPGPVHYSMGTDSTQDRPPPYTFWSSSTNNANTNITGNTSSSPYQSSFTSSSSGNTMASRVGDDRKRQVRLANNPKEREYYDHLANLYSIIRTVEALEKCWSLNIVSQNEYQKECAQLCKQFKVAQQFSNLERPEDIQRFMIEYDLDCKQAYKRLVEVGMPIAGGVGLAKTIAEAVQHFITLMDSLRLNIAAIDEIQPMLADLVDSVEKSLVVFEGKERLYKWLGTLNKMKASDELDEEQKRQMAHDLENAYSSFHKSLPT